MDFDQLLIELKASDDNGVQFETEEPCSNGALTLPDYDYRRETMPTQNAFYYVCGYLLRKALNIHTCETCIKFSKQISELDFNKLFIYFKAFDRKQCNYGGLRVPSASFVEYMYKLEKIFVSMFPQVCLGKNISHIYFSEMKKIFFLYNCPEFLSDYVIKLFIRLKIFYSVKYANKDIKGKRRQKNTKIAILNHI